MPRRIAPMVRDVMARPGCDFPRLDRIAVTTRARHLHRRPHRPCHGAEGLGLALDVPVIGIDTLSAIAANATAR